MVSHSITGLNPSDTIKESNVNINSLINANPWRHHNPYVYDPAAAVALIGYSPYGPSYSPHMDLAGRRKNATRETTATLKAWLYEHRKNPYPTKSEKVYLAIMTKMTLTQVSTWFANARRRLKKENKMTWSPRNRTNDDDDDDRQGAGSNSDVSDDECSSPPARITTQNHYSSAPLIVLQHQQTTTTTPDESSSSSRKRKCDEIEPIERKKSSGIWSLADMAEKNPHRSSSISLQERQNTTSQTTSTIGAFKPFK
ncbi:unnamed protein product [Adineta steineri]|uniref:Homeobox domain-containing protein n=1 Tax=Adineta steineri TaxID=433720 RepID=A0A815J7Q7_9BILA|nr:unnamed protein product [Adineta steineri]CAF1375716.1 unnamed protein product [Adineta steineri]CAF1501271.1 unnamed protein product [Adineta steineri]CAF3599018.1 unnamed protein product [Adineta steineri]CAF3878922.1 unnamed protein product [Adineta steineri]